MICCRTVSARAFSSFSEQSFPAFSSNDDTRKRFYLRTELNIISSFAGFTVGGGIGAAEQGADAEHKAVIEILLCCIKAAD